MKVFFLLRTEVVTLSFRNNESDAVS